MTDHIPLDGEIRQCLEVLQAIRVLQRWLIGGPLGADAMYLTSTCLTLGAGSDVVISVALPGQEGAPAP